MGQCQCKSLLNTTSLQSSSEHLESMSAAQEENALPNDEEEYFSGQENAASSSSSSSMPSLVVRHLLHRDLTNDASSNSEDEISSSSPASSTDRMPLLLPRRNSSSSESMPMILTRRYSTSSDDENSSDSSHNNRLQMQHSSSSASEEEENEELPQARQHAYLPGISHPLWISSSTTTTTTTPTQSYLELPILQLRSIILFPGSTLPLRLRHPDWISYLGTQIQRAKYNGVDTKVQIGIITHVGTRRRSRRRRRVRSSERAATATGSSGGRVGRWRTELIRRGGGPSRSSTNAAASTSAAAASSSSSPQQEEVVPPPIIYQQPPTPPQPQEPHDKFIGRIGTIATITYTHEEEEEEGRNRNLLIVTALGTGRFRIKSRINTLDDYTNTTQQQQQQQNPHLEYGDMANIHLYQVCNLQMEENIPYPPPSSYLHRPLFSSHHHPLTPQPATTKKKKTLIQEDNIITNLSIVTGVPSFVYKYVWPRRLVQDIVSMVMEHEEWDGLKKSLIINFLSGDEDEYNAGDGSTLLEEEAMAEANNTTTTTSTQSTTTTQTNSGNSNNNNHNTKHINPTSFSYWMASNLPLFSDNDKLELLETNSTIHRLQFILEKMKMEKQQQQRKMLYCKHCGVDISRVGNMFTVGGAEGTTGAYVNEHGIIHQTITLREVNMDNIFCIGLPETRDSWFPGYSWTITNCSICNSHLGWKFLKVKRRHSHRSSDPNATDESTRGEHNEEDRDRPNMFWGLSNASVTTESTSPQRVLHGRFQLQDWLFLQAAAQQRNNDNWG
mmetsp:Transcript_19093/g.27604  ORF Transcript_19093/g.27604 Transcript_19093/m.27604 type:complete len:783 (+) Transcript_19093:131-2479(+)